MENQGVIPKEKLAVKVLPGPLGSIVTVKNAAPSTQPQEWVSVTVKSDNVDRVEITAVDKTGKQIVTKTVTIKDSSKPFEVKFDEPVPAESIAMIVYTKTPGTPSNTEIVSAVACVRAPGADETTTVGTTTAPGTTVPGTTAGTPGTTAGTPGTTSGTPGTTSGTPGTTVPGTTIGVPGTTVATKPKPVCLQQMANQGVLPKDKLSVVKTTSGLTSTLTVQSPLKDGSTSVWVSLTVQSPTGAAKDVTVTPVDKDNKAVGQPEKKTISDPSKPVTVTFATPVTASKINAVFTVSSDKPSDVDVVSAEACIYSADITPAATTTPTPETTTLPTTTVAPPKTPTTPIPLVCTSPLEPSECLCHKTCDSLADKKTKCVAPGSTECQRGCQCPAGTVMQNGQCVKEMDCPCYYKGNFYKTNERIPVPGLHCTYMICTETGMKQLVDKECKPEVTCTSGRTFQLCPCERTCNTEKHTCDQTQCQPACACPVDTVWDGVQCVSKIKCACQEGNTTYSNGQSWNSGECSVCHCVDGTQKCAEICRLTQEDCAKQGKTLVNKDLRDGVCCRCVSEEPHCLYLEQEKKIGDIWHEGLCTTFKCSKTELGTGMIVKTKTECPSCEADEVKEYVANKCCPICRKKATTPVTPTQPETPIRGERCGEIMKNTDEMNEKRITLEPAKDSKPTDISPRGKGWSVTVEEKPTITLDLSTDKATRPGLLQSLRVLGNTKSITIQYSDVRPTAGSPVTYKDYNKGKPIDVEKSAVRLVSENSVDSGLSVYKVKITVVEAVDKTKPLKLKLKAQACIEDAPEPCDESDLEELVCTEIMRSTSELPDKRITLEPSDKGSVKDLRPSGKGWMVDEDDLASVKIDLSSRDGKKPGLIEKLGVSGNVKSVIVEYRPTRAGVKLAGANKDGFISYNNGKPVTVEKEEIVLKNPATGKSGLIVYDVRITPVEPVVEDKPYALKLKVYACIQVEYNEVVLPEEPSTDKPTKPGTPKKGDKPETPEGTKDPKEPKEPKEPTGCTNVFENGELPKDRITLTPKDKGTPEDLLPSGKGWPVSKGEKPVIIVDISSYPDSRKPGLVDQITVLGNVKTVKVEVQEIRPRDNRKINPEDKLRPDSFVDFNDGKPVDVEKKPIKFTDPITDKPGRIVYRIRITPLEPINPDKPMNIRLRVIACVQGREPTVKPHIPHKPTKPIRVPTVDVVDVKRITLTPANKGEPKDVLPEGKGWPVTKDDKPSVTINLASPDGKKPGLLDSIKVSGNVKTVNVEVQKIRPRDGRKIKPDDKLDPQGFKKYNTDKPVDVTKKPIVFKSKVTKKPGVLVYQVRITPVDPVDPTKPFNLKVHVKACIIDPNSKVSCKPRKPVLPTKPKRVPTVDVVDVKRITLTPANKGEPKDVLPAGKGWPVTKDDKPSVTINLASPDGKKPGLLDSIKVTGNVKTVNVEVQKIRPRDGRKIKPGDKLDPQGFKKYNTDKPVDVTKKPIVFKSKVTKKPGVVVYQVRITPVDPVDPTKPFSLKIKVKACIQDPSSKISCKPKKPVLPTKPKRVPTVDVVDVKRITLTPANKGEPKDVLPEGKGWPVTKDDKPSVTINLASPDGKKPGLLDSIKVSGNVKTVNVEVQKIRPRDGRKIKPDDKLDPQGFKKYNTDKPVDVTKKPIVFKSKVTKKPGVLVYQVRITPVDPVDPTKPFNLKIKVKACIQDKGSKISCRPTKPLIGSKPSIGCIDVLKKDGVAEKRIKLSPADKGTPKDLLPKGKGWSVTKNDKPSVTINLTSPNGKKPGLLDNIKVSGNVKTVNVEVQKIRPRDGRKIKPDDKLDPQGFKKYNTGKPVDVTKKPIVFKSKVTKKPGVLVYQVRITPVDPVDPTKPFNLKINVKACIQDKTKPKKTIKKVKKPSGEGCVDVMKDPKELPNDRITLQPSDKGTPTELRPKGKGWPVTKSDKPVIRVNLASSDYRKPGLLRKIQVLGNVKEVGVRYRTIRPRKDRKVIVKDEQIDPQGFQEYNNGKPVKVQDVDLIFRDPVNNKPGRMVYDVEITLLEPIKPEQPFNAKLKVNACIQNDLEFISKNELKDLVDFIKSTITKQQQKDKTPVPA